MHHILYSDNLVPQPQHERKVHGVPDIPKGIGANNTNRLQFQGSNIKSVSYTFKCVTAAGVHGARRDSTAFASWRRSCSMVSMRVCMSSSRYLSDISCSSVDRVV